jgi:hypothetical protein
MSSPNPEEVLQLAKQIVDVKATLAALQSKWDGYFASSPVAANGVAIPVSAEPRRGGRKPDADSVTGRVVAFINSDPLAHYDAGDISRGLGIEKKQAELILFKLYANKRIGKHSRGNYEAIA